MHNHETPPHDIRDRSFEFAIRIVDLYNDAEEALPFLDQLLLAGTTIGALVEDAHSGHNKPLFAEKMDAACKKARETHYWLRLFAETQPSPQKELLSLTDEATQLTAILTSIATNSRDR